MPVSFSILDASTQPAPAGVVITVGAHPAPISSTSRSGVRVASGAPHTTTEMLITAVTSTPIHAESVHISRRCRHPKHRLRTPLLGTTDKRARRTVAAGPTSDPP